MKGAGWPARQQPLTMRNTIMNLSFGHGLNKTTFELFIFPLVIFIRLPGVGEFYSGPNDRWVFSSWSDVRIAENR